MKKMIALVSALVLAAVTVRAASVNWEINLGKDAGANKLYYVFDTADMEDVMSDLGSLSGDALTTALESASLANGTLSSKKGAASGDATPAPAGLTFLVLDSDTSAGASYIYTDSISTSGLTYEGTQTPPGTASVASSAFGNSGTIAVPEPTTVALLALGLAALGLKRKVA